MKNSLQTHNTHPFQLVKFLSWSSLLLILSSSLVLSVFMANYAREIVLKKNHEFALLLAENLNHQIYQRFTLPTILGFGRIELKQKAQYDRLEQVVRSTIHSFHVLDVRIYDNDGIVSYATDKKLLGQKGLADRSVFKAITSGAYSFNLQKKLSNWKAMFTFKLEPESVVLRTVYPLRAERTLGLRDEPIMGILEFTQDISSDYENIVHFQWLIIMVSFASSLILFLLLFMIIRRADRMLAERVREKERLEKELHQNEKLASMGRMVASIAHEIRNPLGIIRSSSELLFKKAKKENSPHTRLLEAIFQESRRLSQTVNDFLDYARPKQPKMGDVDLVQVIDEALAFLHTEIKRKNVQVEKIGPEHVLVKGDKDLLYRAFYNLLGNGLEAVESEGWIKIIFHEKGPEVEILDSGPGFEPGMIDRYLEPFYTTKDSGTGLGLAIANNILSNHGARLILENHEQGGARVRVRFD
ncbi:sensor histidine kinase [Desulfovulcanus sp.]